ncbi:MAG: ACT domain-containing protein [Chloroflexota bacterium]|nr:ACT domain-containing protein [Chloroflexota bacterium]
MPAGAPIPSWAFSGSLVSVTRTPDELSIVCPQASVPPGIQSEPGWRCFQVPGPLDFALTGILARLTAPLAATGLPVFALSTFDTDYLLIRQADAARALAAWAASGIEVDA